MGTPDVRIEDQTLFLNSIRFRWEGFARAQADLGLDRLNLLGLTPVMLICQLQQVELIALSSSGSQRRYFSTNSAAYSYYPRKDVFSA
jgi:hypothetical protein